MLLIHLLIAANKVLAAKQINRQINTEVNSNDSINIYECDLCFNFAIFIFS